jgi:hypothetical protein
MRHFSIIGLGSGLASALLCYSAAKGSPALSAALFLLAPLPMLVAGLGWGWLAATVAALAASIALGIASGMRAALAHGLAMGLPAVVTAYLAYLSRPDPYEEDTREWYPVGRLMAAVAIYAGALPVLVLPLIGGSYEAMRRPLGQMLQRAEALGMKAFTEDQALAALPAAFSAYWLIILTLNLYLAGRIVLASGRLARDWPDIPAMAYPAGFPLLLVAAIAASYAPGTLGIAGTSLTGGLLVAYLVAGLALMHFIARGRAPWALWLVYAALILFGPYAAIVVTLGGLIDPVFRLKQRLGARPPSK